MASRHARGCRKKLTLFDLNRDKSFFLLEFRLQAAGEPKLEMKTDDARRRNEGEGRQVVE
jgi:hypothetical protein